jgi:protein gp37
MLPGYTFNPWIGCTQFSAGCKLCYAETLNERYSWAEWGRGGARHLTADSNYRKPLKWNKVSAQVFERYGVRLRVFCGSLCDWADSEVDESWRQNLFTLIGNCPGLDWLMLTKRLDVKTWERFSSGYDRMQAILPLDWLIEWPENVWFGHSLAEQKDADIVLPQLKRLVKDFAPSQVFISYGPAIGPINWAGYEGLVNQILVEGESGKGDAVRAFMLHWASDTLAWAKGAGVSFYMKQLGSKPRRLLFGDGPQIVDCKGPSGEAITGKGGDVSQWPDQLKVREYLTTLAKVPK